MMTTKTIKEVEREQIEEVLVRELGEQFELIIESEYEMSVDEFINTYIRKQYYTDSWNDLYWKSMNGKYKDDNGTYDWVVEF